MANGREDGEAAGADESVASDRAALLADNRERRAKIRADEQAKAERSGGGETTDGGAAGRDTAGADSGSAEEPDGKEELGVMPVRPSGRIIAVLGALVAVLAVAVAILGYLYATSGSAENADARAKAIDDAKTYATSVLTYSAGDYADLDKRIREISTPEFADRYITSSQKAREGNDEAQATGSAEAKEAGLVSMSDTTAVVLVAIDQTVKTPLVPAVGPDGMDYQSRVKITLMRDGDDWKMSDLSVV